MPSRARRERLITPSFLALTVAELAYFVAIGAMIPTVPLFAAGPLGAGAVGVGFAIGLFSVTALVLRPFAGRLADRWGSGRLFFVGAVLFTVVAASHLMVTAYWALLIVRVALGVAEALFFVAGMAALAGLAPPDRLGEAISYNSLGLYLGIALGPALGEWLLRSGGFRAAWLGVTGLGLVAALLALKVPVMRRDTAAEEPSPLLPRQLIAPGLAFLAGLLGAAGFLAFAALHARGIGMDGAAWVLFGYGAMVIGCRLLFARLADRFPAPALSSWALVWCSAGLATVGVVRTSVGLFVGAALVAFGITFLTPAFYREMMAALPPAQHGAAAATFSIAVDLGLGGGPIAFGLIAELGGIPAAFTAAAVGALVAAALTARRAAPRRGTGA
jgi:predicted MFS family arabinose efflux permease